MGGETDLPGSVAPDEEYYRVPGCGQDVSQWAGRVAATFWTVTATIDLAGLNILTWLTAYLDACGRNTGKPLTGPDLDRFLPWNATPEDLRTWAQPPPPQPG